MGTSFGVFDSLAQYGILGIFTLALGAALWFLLKRQLESEDQLKNSILIMVSLILVLMVTKLQHILNIYPLFGILNELLYKSVS